jgi:hypothetical protein
LPTENAVRIFTYFYSALVFSAQAFAQPPAPSAQAVSQILADGAFYLFTNPKSCVPCRVLEEQLAASGQTERLSVKDPLGNLRQIPIVRIDPWAKDADRVRLEKLGYQDQGLPQYALLEGGKVQSRGRPSSSAFDNFDKASIFTPEFRRELLPRKSETLSVYVKRLEAFGEETKKKLKSQSDDKSPLDLSKTLARDLGFKVPQPLVANPGFRPTLGSSNILVVGTANLPLNNPLFTGMTIDKVKKSLGEIGATAAKVVLYGSGQDAICDTCQSLAGDGAEGSSERQEELIKYNVAADASPTRENIVSFFMAAKKGRSQNNLVVLVGHGETSGFPTWTDPFDPFSADEMSRLHRFTGANDVLVSGNCFGGVMANSMSCSFTAASPTTTASGCWTDARSGKNLDDYVSLFFRALGDPKADLKGDGKITFAEAHAYAIANAAKEDKPYATTDALADEYFRQHPEALPETIDIKQIRDTLGGRADAVEDRALAKKLTQNLDASQKFALKSMSGTIDTRLLSATYYYNAQTGEKSVTNARIKDLSLIEQALPSNATRNFSLSPPSPGDQADKLSLSVELNQHFMSRGQGVPSEVGMNMARKMIELGDKIEGASGSAELPGGIIYRSKDQKGMTTYYARGQVGDLNGKFNYEAGANTVMMYDLDDSSGKKVAALAGLPSDAVVQSAYFSKERNSISYFSASEAASNPEKVFSARVIVTLPEDLQMPSPFPRALLVQQNLMTLARRLLFKAAIKTDPEWSKRAAQVRSCEDQVVADFVGGRSRIPAQGQAPDGGPGPQIDTAN